MDNYLVVSFYTKDTPYEEEIKKLEESLIKFSIPYKFYPTENTGDHIQNVKMKATVVLKALIEKRNNVVWMDSDNVVLSHPYELDRLNSGVLTHDFASVIVWGRPTRNPPARARNWKLAANVMFFRNNALMHKICRKWVEGCRASVRSDHPVLFDTIYDHRDEVSVYYLPMQYAREVPFKAPEESYHTVLHNTVSRKYYRGEWDL